MRWIKKGDQWTTEEGELKARVGVPTGPLAFSHWSVWTNTQRWGSGGSQSVKRAKKAAEQEIARILQRSRVI